MAFTRYTAPIVSPNLGRADGYELIIVDRTLRRRIRPVPFSTLKWGRVEADSSRLNASVPAWGEVPLRGIRPWQHGLAVVRNGILEWAGPITTVRRATDAERVDLSAFDILGWTMKRFVRSIIDMPTADYGLVFDRLIEEATTRDNVFQLTSSTPPTGVAGDKSYSGTSNDQIFQAIQELGRNGMDFTVAALAVISGPTGRLFTGFTHLDESAFIGRIGAELDGMSQTNSTRVAAGGTGGSEGYTVMADFEEWTARSGLLESFESEADVRDLDGAQAAARLRWDTFHDAPLIVSFPPLSPAFPCSMAELIPGKTFRLQIVDQLFDLAGDYLLKQLDVDVDVAADGAITEKVTVEMEKVQPGPAETARAVARAEESSPGGVGDPGEEDPEVPDALLLYDTREWVESDVILANLGTAGSDYDLDITTDLAYDNAYGTQVNDYYGYLSIPGAIAWGDLGGTPGVGGVFTFVFCTGNTADGAGFAEFSFVGTAATNSITPGIINYDGTMVGPDAVVDMPDAALLVEGGLFTNYSPGAAADEIVYFIEVDYTASPAYIEIREGESVVASDTKAAYGGGVIDGIYDPGSEIELTIVGADIGWTAPQWRMKGMAMIRGALDTAGRTEWTDYFT